jgi:hypothetical protein
LIVPCKHIRARSADTCGDDGIKSDRGRHATCFDPRSIKLLAITIAKSLTDITDAADTSSDTKLAMLGRILVECIAELAMCVQEREKDSEGEN